MSNYYYVVSYSNNILGTKTKNMIPVETLFRKKLFWPNRDCRLLKFYINNICCVCSIWYASIMQWCHSSFNRWISTELGYQVQNLSCNQCNVAIKVECYKSYSETIANINIVTPLKIKTIMTILSTRNLYRILIQQKKPLRIAVHIKNIYS